MAKIYEQKLTSGHISLPAAVTQQEKRSHHYLVTITAVRGINAMMTKIYLCYWSVIIAIIIMIISWRYIIIVLLNDDVWKKKKKKRSNSRSNTAR